MFFIPALDKYVNACYNKYTIKNCSFYGGRLYGGPDHCFGPLDSYQEAVKAPFVTIGGGLLYMCLNGRFIGKFNNKNRRRRMFKFLRVISWLLYIASFIFAIVNIFTLEYQYIADKLLLVSLIFFLVGGIILFTQGRKYQIEKEGILTCGVTNKLIRKLFTIIGGLCMIIVIIAMLSIFIYGGQPTIIDGIYCTRQHGKIIKVLTMEEYNFLYFLEKELFACGSLLLNALFLGNSKRRKKQR